MHQRARSVGAQLAHWGCPLIARLHGNPSRRLIEKACAHCRQPFMGRVDHDHENRGRYCSTKCRWDAARGTPHPTVRSMIFRAPSREIQIAAQQHVTWLVKTGRLVRPGCCSTCPKECTPHGHHMDYSKPDEVVWLCVLCHLRAHHDRKFIAGLKSLIVRPAGRLVKGGAL